MAKNYIIKIKKADYNIYDTLDCGQCFRFKKTDDGSFFGVAFNKPLKVLQTDDEITFYNTSDDDFNKIWRSYFDFDTDYNAIKKLLCTDEALKNAIEFDGGIHILRQDSFEALISFLVSQNNNIPRISKSIDKLCNKFGSKIADGIYAFPTISQLENIEKEDLSDIGLGYRDDYIIDCVQKLKNGDIVLDEIRNMPIEDARVKLRTIKGVGPKVAECALLYGFYRVEAFPIDTWIKKVLSTHYPNGFPKEFSAVAGIAQQYLFHSMRKAGI